MTQGSPAGRPLIVAKDLSCVFSRGGLLSRQHTVALKAIDLTVERTDTLALVGESGSGKTTLAMILLGLQKATSGTVEIAGSPIEGYGRRELARLVQPVFQDPYSSLNPRQTVERILALPLIVHGKDRAAGRQRMLEVMDAVGMARRHLDAYPSQLSGGQRQRVAIARALMVRPEILICDELTSALDVSVQSQILNLLTEIKREFGLTYIVITHNFTVAEYLASRVCVMRAGEVVEQAPAGRFFSGPDHPYSRALLEAVPTIVPRGQMAAMAER
jgi:peptide/nickel transport system ATP-binding protein